MIATWKFFFLTLALSHSRLFYDLRRGRGEKKGSKDVVVRPTNDECAAWWRVKEIKICGGKKTKKNEETFCLGEPQGSRAQTHTYGVEQPLCRLRLMRELLLSVNVYLTPGFVRAMKNCHVCVPCTSSFSLSPLSVSYIRSKRRATESFHV